MTKVFQIKVGKHQTGIIGKEICIKADLEHIVKDFKEISKYGVMGLPALVINGKVKAVDSVTPQSSTQRFYSGSTSRIKKTAVAVI